VEASDLSNEVLTDLFRSGWIIESARATVYERWAAADPSYAGGAAVARTRAGLVAEGLGSVGRSPDEALVEAHARWMLGLVGEAPEEVPLGNLFVARIGDWVEAHVADFLPSGADELRAAGDEERASLKFPESLPPPPAFEPVVAPPVEPPGEVRFRFAILADLHFGSRVGDERAEAAIDDLNRSGAELVVQLGDITDHGQKAEFDSAKKALGRLEMPLVTMMGNHDVLSLEEERLSGREYYSGAFDREPDGVIVEHKGMRFAVLDSVEHAASPLPAFDFVSGSFVEKVGGAIVRGSLTPPQHEILADVAGPDSAPAFVFLHHPPQPFTAFPPVLFGLREADSGRLHATIDSGNVWGVFAGHTHRNARTRDFDGVPAHEVAIPRDYPFGYALVDVTDDGYAFRFVQLSNEELLREAYKHSGHIHRRYGRGRDEDLAFVWTRPAKS
jgi:hypothetical protein